MLEALNKKKHELEEAIDACYKAIAEAEANVKQAEAKLSIINEMIEEELAKVEAPVAEESVETEADEAIVINYGSGA